MDVHHDQKARVRELNFDFSGPYSLYFNCRPDPIVEEAKFKITHTGKFNINLYVYTDVSEKLYREKFPLNIRYVTKLESLPGLLLEQLGIDVDIPDNEVGTASIMFF